MDMTTETRCNWCSHPLIFHSSRRTRWHGWLCWLNGMAETFTLEPITRRTYKEDACEESR